MNKELRKQVFNKFNGLCAYTGKSLVDGYQIDHIFPKAHFQYKNIGGFEKPDDINNLFPCLKIINHYKRDKNLEQFRSYMMSFHLRLAKLPKKTNSPKTQNRIFYMNNIANLFGITIDKPFDGVFYFERFCQK